MTGFDVPKPLTASTPITSVPWGLSMAHTNSFCELSAVVVPPQGLIMGHVGDSTSEPSAAVVPPQGLTMGHIGGSNSEPSANVVPPQGLTMGHIGGSNFEPFAAVVPPQSLTMGNIGGSNSKPFAALVPPQGLTMGHIGGSNSEPSAVAAVGGEGSNVGQMGDSSESLKRKRETPMEYGFGAQMPSATMFSSPQPPSFVAVHVNQSDLPFCPTLPSFTIPDSSDKGKDNACKSADKNNYSKSLGIEGDEFTPHVINLKVGEDLSESIMSFSKASSRNVVVLSASGSLSVVTLCIPAATNGVVTYEGIYDILSFKGSFLVAGNNDELRGGSMSVTLCMPNGDILGGTVAGALIAATPVQLVLGSFGYESSKKMKNMLS